MIRDLSSRDAEEIFKIINTAATAYRGHIPDDRYHEPYMSKDELDHEIESVIFFGWQEKDKLVGVMGLQPIKGVTLIRHTYILPDYQGLGIGRSLIEHVRRATKTKQLLVGTWAGAEWAIHFYVKQGFKLMPNKDSLLKRYWDVPRRQIETSVVLGIDLR